MSGHTRICHMLNGININSGMLYCPRPTFFRIFHHFGIRGRCLMHHDKIRCPGPFGWFTNGVVFSRRGPGSA